MSSVVDRRSLVVEGTRILIVTNDKRPTTNDSRPTNLLSSRTSFMNPGDLFRANLPLIDRTIDRVCRRARLFGPDAEDFASDVRLALMADDYAVLRKWEQRSSLATFLTVVVQRMLVDRRVRTYG